MNNIRQIVSSSFKDCGTGTNLFGQYREAQSEFAESVSDFFDESENVSKTKVAIIEASTGVGKGFGYLVPLLLQSVFNGKRVAIATHTRHLQHQLNLDVNSVIEKLGPLLARTPTLATRFGSDEYFHLDSIVFFLGNPPTDNQEELTRLHNLYAWQVISENVDNKEIDCNVHTGRIGDYLAQQKITSLPFGLTKGDISIRPHHHSEEKVCLLRDIEKSKNSDVVIVTQAMLMLHIKTGAEILNHERQIDYLVIDEADKIGSAAESIFQSGFSLSVHHKHFENLANSSIHFHESFSDYTKTVEYLSDIAIDNPSNKLLIDSENLHHQNIIKYISKLHTSLGRTLAAVHAKKTILLESYQSLHSLYFELSTFTKTLQRNDTIAAPLISWSEVYGFPSLIVAPINTGFLTAKLFGKTKDSEKLFKKILFTSATLSTKSDSLDFGAFKIMAGVFAGIKANKAVLQAEIVFKAQDYGRISMILSPNNAPKPIYIDSDKSVLFESSFLNRVVHFARFALESSDLQDCGKRTLILTCSYEETFAICKSLRAGGLSPIEHEKGISLNEYVKSFRSDSKAILVSCVAWEGFDERIANLIITRVPFIQFGHIHEQKINHFISYGYSEKVAKNIIQKQLQFESQRKLTQGIGRLIRRKGDMGRLMFCDPRVKKFKSAKWSKTLDSKPLTLQYSIEASLKCDYHIKAWQMATVLTDNETIKIINIDGDIKSKLNYSEKI
tara:strand:- start:73913 stop:76093 length:2181 start_codon:yes stop_codon:yes gene_type:complete